MEELVAHQCEDHTEIRVEDAYNWIKQIMCGLLHLHSKGIAHHDLNGMIV